MATANEMALRGNAEPQEINPPSHHTTAKVLVSTRGLDRAAWLAARRQGIGGSDIAAIAGLSPWRTALDVFLEKIGSADEQPESPAMEWGIRLEPVIADKVAELHPTWKVRRRNAILQHPQYSWALANVDRIVIDPERGPGICEIKTGSAYRTKEWEGNVPDYYTVQLQWYLGITGYTWGIFAVLLGGQDYREVIVDADPEVFGYLLTIGHQFWTAVESRIPPVLDGSEAASTLVKQLYPEAEPGRSIELPSEALTLIAQYTEAKAAETAAAERRAEAENRLKAMLETAEIGRCAGYRVEWKSITSQRLDTKRFKAEHPDLYNTYAQPIVSRRFVIKEA